MKKTIYGILLIILLFFFSAIIMILPTFFSEGVSRFSTNQEIDLPLVLNDEKDIKLIFFGYSGCVDVCTPRLESLSKIYKGFEEPVKKRVGVEFLDISRPQDKMLPQVFAGYFHQDFKGIYLNDVVLRKYTKEFSVYFSKSLMDENEFDHTAHLYIVKRDGLKKTIRYIYNTYPYDEMQIKKDIKGLIDENRTK